MAEYQNILTQVQVRGPAEMGLDEKGVLAAERGVEPRFMSILGYVGNAQIGPLHLGMFGLNLLTSTRSLRPSFPEASTPRRAKTLPLCQKACATVYRTSTGGNFRGRQLLRKSTANPSSAGFHDCSHNRSSVEPSPLSFW
jgi:hypothetical protein